jgi:hypothetical protein
VKRTAASVFFSAKSPPLYPDNFVTVCVMAEIPRIFQDDHCSDGSQFVNFVFIVISALTTCRDLSSPM